MAPTPDTTSAPDAPEHERDPEHEGALLRYWRAQPGSALFLIAAILGCAIVFPLMGVFPEGFGVVRQVAAGAFIGLGFGMLPVAHRIWD